MAGGAFRTWWWGFKTAAVWWAACVIKVSFGTITCNLRQQVNARLDDAHMICVRLNDVKITNGVDRRHSHYTW